MAVAAVDLGASSGRVLLVIWIDGHLTMEQVARFANGGHDVDGVFSWDVPYLLAEIERGLGEATRAASARGLPLASLGVDSWAVDYGLLDAEGELMRLPAHHRDQRTKDSYAAVTRVINPWELYRRNGIAPLTFNTLFQLVADGELAQRARHLLLIPDLINYYLCGRRGWEITNASTTQLLNVRRDWDDEIFEQFGLERRLVGELTYPGEVLGPVTAASAIASGVAASTQVIAVASHDTASAVVAVPAVDRNFAYVSSGTWSLVGVELDEPLINRAAFDAGYTNELGAFGRTRFLRNVMGFWLLQEVIREFGLEGTDLDAPTLTREARELTPRTFLVDAESEQLLATGDMRGRLARQCAAMGTAIPVTPAEFTRCIIDSLALAYRRAIQGISRVTGVRIDTVHIVGGGAMNELLCQLTADACGVTVHAGPVEAAAIGNALLQLRGLDVVGPNPEIIRQVVASSFPTRTFRPRVADARQWAAADESLSERRPRP